MYWITGILGIAFLVSPFVFGYNTNPAALWTSLLVGATVLVMSVFERATEDKGNWEYWVAVFLGIGAILAPFMFGFATHIAATWTSVIVGLLIALVAGTKVLASP